MTRVSTPGRSDSQGVDLFAGFFGLGPAADERGGGVFPQAGKGDVLADGHRGDQAGFAAVFGYQKNSGGDGIAGVANAQLFAIEGQVSVQRPGGRRILFRPVLIVPAPTNPAMPRISPPAASRVTAVCGQASVRTSLTRNRGCVAVAGSGDVKAAQIPADHQADHVVMGDLIARQFTGVAAVAQAHHAVGNLGDLAEAVRNINDADALVCELFHGLQEGGLVSAAVRELVGSSRTRMRAFCERALAISTSCCWAMERFLTRRARIDIQAEAFQVGPAVVDDFSTVDQLQRPAPERLAAEENVGGDFEIFQVVQFLVDEADPQLHRIGDRADDDRLWPSMTILPSSGW